MDGKNLEGLIAALKELEQQYLKDGRAYLKLANVIPGSKPDESPPEVRGLVYSSGTYQLCAKGIRDILKKFGVWEVNINHAPDSSQKTPKDC